MTTLNQSDDSQFGFQWRSAAVSALVHVVGIFVLLVIPVQVIHQVSRTNITLTAPILEKATPPETLPPPPPRAVQKQAVITPKYQPPEPVREKPKPMLEPLPQPAAAPKLAAIAPPKLPEVPQVKAVPEFQQQVAAAPTTAPKIHVQEGGFGEALGTKKESTETAKLSLPKLGGFELPQGSGEGGKRVGEAKTGVVGATGFDSTSTARTNRPGTPGPVQTGGFGGSPTGQPGGRGTSASGAVQTGGFGDGATAGPGGHGTAPAGEVKAGTFETAPAAAKPTKPQQAEPPTIPVEILNKPKPAYTEEARRLKIEGEVWLKIVFGADKSLKVLGISRGLGHGLDEAAVQAAQQIQFKPALRDGKPVDFTANVRIVFQLA